MTALTLSVHDRCGERLAAGSREAKAGVAPTRYFLWKHRLDFLLAVLLAIPVLPLIALLVLVVRLTSKGPGIYRQVRVGKDGRTFTIYKIRSMTCDAEARSGAVWSQCGDPRVTLVGRFLRASHLDELPQLFNVLRGEMSLVGPRPERPEFVGVLTEKIPGYLDRLAVRPGVTGLAQVNLPPDSDLASVRRKLYLDRQYVLQGGLWLDLRLLLCTAVRILKVPEGLLLRLLGLDRKVPEPAANEASADLAVVFGAAASARHDAAHEPVAGAFSPVLHAPASVVE